MVFPIFVCSVSVSPRCHALRCYSYSTNKDGIPQSYHAVTCDQRQTSCLTITTIIHGQISRYYSCWFGFNSCTTVAGQKNETYIHVQNCCQGDLCNDGMNKGQTFESGKKYCYAATCSGENCLSKLQKVIDRDNLGTFCSQNGEECYTQRYKMVNTEGRKITDPAGIEFDFIQPEYHTGCNTPEHPCEPYRSHDLTVTCCREHLCNGVNYTEQQDITEQQNTTEQQTCQCYVVSCTGEKDCLQESIQLENNTFCTQTSFGCEAVLTKTGADNMYTLGCSTSLCVPGYTRSQDKTVIGCCRGDQCFPKFHNIGPSSVAACLISSTAILYALLIVGLMSSVRCLNRH